MTKNLPFDSFRRIVKAGLSTTHFESLAKPILFDMNILTSAMVSFGESLS
jgi:hypothetical protein